MSNQLRRFLLDEDLGADPGPAGRSGSESGLRNICRSPRRSWNVYLGIKEKPGLITHTCEGVNVISLLDVGVCCFDTSHSLSGVVLSAGQGVALSTA